MHTEQQHVSRLKVRKKRKNSKKEKPETKKSVLLDSPN